MGKTAKTGKAPNPLADMFNLQMPEDDEEALMAELAALQGIAPKKKAGKAAPDKNMTYDQIMAQSEALLHDDEDSDDDNIDDDDLMAELGDILGEDDVDLVELMETQAPTPAAQRQALAQRQAPARPTMTHPAPSPPAVQSAVPPSNDLEVVTERRAVYVAMLEKCKREGDNNKVRRYDRIIKQYDTALRTLKSGKPIDLASLPEPPPGFTVDSVNKAKPAAAPAPVKAPAPPPPSNNQMEEPLIDLTEPPVPVPEKEKKVLNVNVVDLLDAVNSYQAPQKVDNQVVTLLKERGAKYRTVALHLHKQGRTDQAKEFLGISKQFEQALNGYMLGENVDLSEIPPDPADYMAAQQAQASAPSAAPSTAPSAAPSAAPAPPPGPSGGPVDEQATIVSLNIRLDAYKSQQAKAQAEGNGSKARRMGRIITQCEGLIKAVKLKRPVNFASLPDLPGADPIPLPPYMRGPPVQPRPAQPAPVQPAQPQPAPVQPAQPQPAAQPEPASTGTDTLTELHKRMIFYTEAAEKAKAEGNTSKVRRMMRVIDQHQQYVKLVKLQKPLDVTAIPDLPGFEPVPVPAYMKQQQQQQQPLSSSSSISVKDQVKFSAADKNLEILIERQAEYKNAALKLYKEGNQVEAKKYLAQAKGFDPMIEASKRGLPVDIDKIPPSLSAPAPNKKVLSRQNTLPQMKGDIIDMGPISGDIQEIYNQLVEDLSHQIELCKNNATTFQKLGDLKSGKHYAQQYKNQNKDLANLKGIYTQKKGLPAYRYETCRFPILKCCPEISDREAEIVFVRCLNLPLPQGYKADDMKIFINWEFNMQDRVQKGQTKSIKGGINPEIFESFKVEIDRTNRGFTRWIKRGSVKATVYYERGFLKKPGEVGQCSVKLGDWENLSEIHEAATLLDGRKQTASKVEVKLRIREPVGGAQCEFSEMKWLIIGNSGSVPSNPNPALAPAAVARRGGSPANPGRRGSSPNPRTDRRRQ